MKRWWDVPKLRRRVYLPPLAAAASLLVALPVDMLLHHRRAVRLRAAWSYDTQDEHCRRLAAAHARDATRERAEAELWPEGSAERENHRRNAIVASSLGTASAGVAEQA